MRGSYTDEENNHVDLDGRIGSGGYRMSGTRTWYTSSGKLGGRGTFAWELVGYRSNQFRGWIAGAGSRKERCGWRSGFTQPVPCKLN